MSRVIKTKDRAPTTFIFEIEASNNSDIPPKKGVATEPARYPMPLKTLEAPEPSATVKTWEPSVLTQTLLVWSAAMEVMELPEEMGAPMVGLPVPLALITGTTCTTPSTAIQHRHRAVQLEFSHNRVKLFWSMDLHLSFKARSSGVYFVQVQHITLTLSSSHF